MERLTSGGAEQERASDAFQHTRLSQPSENPPINIHLLESLRRHTVLAVFVFLASLALGFGYLHWRYGKNFLAEAIIYVSPNYPQTLSTDRETDHTPYDSFIDEQVHSVTRLDTLMTAIHRMGPGMWRADGESEQAAAQRLAGALEVDRVSATFQVSIGLHGGEPDHLAEIVNAVARTYVENAHHDEFFGLEGRLQGLRDERQNIQNDLNTRLTEQAGLLKDLGLASISSTTINPYNDRIAKLNVDLIGAREQRQAAETALAAVNDPNNPDHTAAIEAEAQDIVANDAGLNGLKTALNERRGKLISDIAGMTEENPVRKQDEIELSDIDASLRKMTRDITTEATTQLQQKYQNQLARSRMYEEQLQSEVAMQSENAAITTPKFQQANELNGDIERLNARINSIRDRIANLELENSSPGSIHLFSPAYTPLAPDSTKSRKLMLVLFPLCFCLGLAAAVARDTLDLRVFTGEDVERSIGLPPIGILFNRDEVSEQVSQEYIFRIAASLDHAVRSSKIKSFAFTSVKPGGGTSTLIDLVAVEMAQLGNRVLVLDAAGEREPIAYLPPEQDDPDTNPKARLLHPELGAYLHSRGRLLPSVNTVTQAFRNVHGDYDALLLDCQPLFISADTEYLVRVSDATVLIVESGKVLKHDLIRAARLLERLHIPGLAIALNKLALSHADAPLREDLRDYITLGRGFAHNKPIPLTTTRFDDTPPPDETQSS